MLLNFIFGGLAVLSLGLTLWQWLAARQFHWHASTVSAGANPPVTVLKPLKGCDASTADCLRSWFAQDYPAALQLLFGVADEGDPVCPVVRALMREFPQREAKLVVYGPLTGTNLKVSKLAEMERLATTEVLVISDADVRVPKDFLARVVPLLDEPAVVEGSGEAAAGCGLVTCFYRLANPTTLAMQWEAVAINADFWSQVLQARQLKPLDFALGAVMATRRRHLEMIGGFLAVKDCLADDYQLGNRLARRGCRIALAPVVVECWAEPMGWSEVWKHQLRWARTIRVCQPAPYFFSILSNASFWPLVWLAAHPGGVQLGAAAVCLSFRILTALDLQRRLNRVEPASVVATARLAPLWLVPVKDLLQVAVWLLAFLGNRIEWRGQRYRLRPDGTLVRK